MQTLGGGAEGGGVTTLTEGDPELKPVESTNVDVCAEWASIKGSDLSIGLFYKGLTHIIYDTFSGFSNPTSTSVGDLVVVRPRNGGSGRVFGLEISGRQRLLGLPQPFNGFSLLGNATLEHSDVRTDASGLDPHERLLNQPDVLLNGQLAFENYGWSAYLSYRYIGAYVSQYATLGASSALDTWTRASSRLDLSLAYRTGLGATIGASVTNLLDNTGYKATVGLASTIPSLVYPGTTLILRLAYAY